jgi:hypothetical protein
MVRVLNNLLFAQLLSLLTLKLNAVCDEEGFPIQLWEEGEWTGVVPPVTHITAVRNKNRGPYLYSYDNSISNFSYKFSIRSDIMEHLNPIFGSWSLQMDAVSSFLSFSINYTQI